jgi:hypothetical protein
MSIILSNLCHSKYYINTYNQKNNDPEKKFAGKQLFSIMCPILIYFILRFFIDISTKGPSSRQG